MSDESDSELTPALAKIFDPYYAQARARYEAALRTNSSLPAPDETSPVAHILAWKDIVDEVFLIKAKRHLPFRQPDDLAERREATIERILSNGFASDRHEANALYKNLARHAHVAFESLCDSEIEAGFKRPYELVIAADGSERYRGAKGRWRSAKSPMHLDLRDALDEMKLGWTERLRDPQRDQLLHKAYGMAMARWNLGCEAISTIEGVADDYGFTEHELFACGDEYLHAKYKYGQHGMMPMHAWTDKNYDRHAQTYLAIDQNGCMPELVQSVLLRRLIGELKPLIWEIAEQRRAADPNRMHFVDDMEMNAGDHHSPEFVAYQNDLQSELKVAIAPSIRRFEPVLIGELNAEEITAFTRDVEALVAAGGETVMRYLRDASKRAEGPSI